MFVHLPPSPLQMATCNFPQIEVQMTQLQGKTAEHNVVEMALRKD